MWVIGQWDSLIQLLTTESAEESMGDSRSPLRPQGSASRPSGGSHVA